MGCLPNDTVVVKKTATWVVEVPRASDPKLFPWDAVTVGEAADLCDGCSWTYETLDRDNLARSDASALNVWRQYRDGKMVK